DRAEHLRYLGGALSPAPLAHARCRPPDGGAPSRLALHGVDGTLGRRLRGRDLIPRKAPPALPPSPQRGHAAVLSLVDRPNVRAMIRAHLRWWSRPRPHAQRTTSTPRVRLSGAA